MNNTNAIQSACRWVANEPAVVSETVDDETIVIHLETGCYYSLMGTAAECWELLRQGGPDVAAVAELTSRYSATSSEITAAWNGFVGSLLQEDLIRKEPADGRTFGTSLTQSAALAEKKAFLAPQINKYEDMKELLLLDPIHDVSVGGWPQQA